MSFIYWAIGCVVATLVVYLALSINGKTEHAGAAHDDHGHDDHGHGHH